MSAKHGKRAVASAGRQEESTNSEEAERRLSRRAALQLVLVSFTSCLLLLFLFLGLVPEAPRAISRRHLTNKNATTELGLEMVAQTSLESRRFRKNKAESLVGPAREETYEEAFSRAEGDDPVRKPLQDSGDADSANLFGGELELSGTAAGPQQEASSRADNQRGKPQGHNPHSKDGNYHFDNWHTADLGAKLHTRPGVTQSEQQKAAASRRRGRGTLFSGKGIISAPAMASQKLHLGSRNLQKRTKLTADSSRAISPAGEVEAFGEVWSANNTAGGAPALSPSAAETPAGAVQGFEGLDDREVALLTARNISAGDRTACNLLLGFPKVAVMFLTKGELHHEATWAAWFRHAAGVYPTHNLKSSCTATKAGEVENFARLVAKVCSGRAGGGVLQQQHLYSVYIHPLPNFGAYPEDSIWRGREISERVQAEWGSHRLVDATRALLRAALADPLNLKFVQLSESGIPLYPPAAIHTQLLAEHKSRMDSCGSGRTDPWRYSGRMGMHVRQHWRKSSQWVALRRDHAQHIVDDTKFYPKFERHCHNAWDSDYGRWRDCFSDEHYFPSLIAFLQLGHETDCIGGLVSVDWSRGGAHPKTYSSKMVTAKLLKQLREKAGRCDSTQLIEYSWENYAAPGASKARQGLCLHEEAANHTLADPILGYKCPLFARKFPQAASNVVFNLLKDCKCGLFITNNGSCSNDIPEQRVAQEKSQRLLLDVMYV